jgi:Proteolysis_6 C-terminal
MFNESDMETGQGIDPAVFAELQYDNLASNFLHLPSIKTCFEALSSEGSFENRLLRSWLEQLKSFQTRNGGIGARSLLLLPRLSCAPPRRFHFVRLPRLYQSLYLRLRETALCENCGAKLDFPCLCMLSGKVVPLNRCKLCNSGPGISPDDHASLSKFGCMNRYAIKNFGGVGLYLMVQQSNFIIMRESRRTIGSAFYLDQFGETDMLLSRGVPLYLDESRYEANVKRFILTSFDHDTVLLNHTDNQDFARY